MTSLKFRIHLIYRADGMTRPLSYRRDVPASSVDEAVRIVTEFIGSAYVSGFRIVTWSAENMTLPVEVKYTLGGSDGSTPEAVHSDTQHRGDAQDSGN